MKHMKQYIVKPILLFVTQKDIMLYSFGKLLFGPDGLLKPLLHKNSLILKHQIQTGFESIVEKKRNCLYPEFLLFPQCFLLNQIIVPHLSIFLTSYFYLLLNLKTPNSAYEEKG